VHREDHALQRARLVLTNRADHQPGRVVDRKAADAGPPSSIVAAWIT